MADRVLRVIDNHVRVNVAGGPLTAALAAQAALPYAERAEQALSEIEQIASEAPEAPSVYNKLDKNAFSAAGEGAVDRLVVAKLRELISILDYIPEDLHDEIAAGTYQGDLTTYWTAAQTAAKGAPIYFPAGTYYGNFVVSKSGAGIVGAGAPNYDNSFEQISGTLLRPYDITMPIIKLDGDASGGFLNNVRIQDLGLTGVNGAGQSRQSPCLHIANTLDTRSVNEMVLRNLNIRSGSAGILCDGSCLSATLDNVFTQFNTDGIVLKSLDASLYINAWTCTNVHTGFNYRHGLVTDSAALSSAMVWVGLKSEFNGIDHTVPECFGIFMKNTEGWTFPGLYMEGNGNGVGTALPLTSGKSYGIKLEGNNKGVGLESGAIIITSTFPIHWTGQNPSGSLNNLYNAVARPLASLTAATWTSTAGGRLTMTVSEDLTGLFDVGHGIVLDGCNTTGGTGRGFNGTFPIVSITADTIVVSLPMSASPGTYVSAGSVNAPEIIIDALWAADLPKIQIGTAIIGAVWTPPDGNGAYCVSPAADYVPAPSPTLSLANRKSVVLNTSSAPVVMTAITGLRAGDTFSITAGPFNTANPATIDSSLMYSGVDSVIAAKTTKSYKVLGAPADGAKVITEA